MFQEIRVFDYSQTYYCASSILFIFPFLLKRHRNVLQEPIVDPMDK